MLLRIVRTLAMAALALLAIGYGAATRSPAIRTYRVALPGWPAAARPLRLVFLSDTHVAGPDMPPSRLDGIVDRVNALRPDCVLLGGDYVSNKPLATRTYTFAEVLAPFARLRPRIGTYGVDGNHDQAVDAAGDTVLPALARVGVHVLANDAAKCGVLTIGGLRDYYGWAKNPPVTAAAAERLGGPSLLLTHAPDPFAYPDSDHFPLVIAGHTHCGQIALPFYGAVLTATRFGRRYACGGVREKGRTLIVGGGLGTSGLPLRLFTRPEIVVIEVGR